MLKKALFVFATLLAFSMAIDVKPCKDPGTIEIRNVTIDVCSKSPCEVDPSKQMKITVEFTSKVDAGSFVPHIEVDHTCVVESVFKNGPAFATLKLKKKKTATVTSLGTNGRYVYGDSVKFQDCSKSQTSAFNLNYGLKNNDNEEIIFCFVIPITLKK